MDLEKGHLRDDLCRSKNHWTNVLIKKLGIRNHDELVTAEREITSLKNILSNEKEKEYPEASMWGPLPAKGFYVRHARNVGFNDVEILTKDGRKLHGMLVNVEDTCFEADVEVMVQVEGKKKKEKQIQTQRFGYEDVKYCKYDLKV